MPTNVTRTSNVDRLLRASGMHIRDGSGAIGICGVACGLLRGFIETHLTPGTAL